MRRRLLPGCRLCRPFGSSLDAHATKLLLTSLSSLVQEAPPRRSQVKGGAAGGRASRVHHVQHHRRGRHLRGVCARQRPQLRPCMFFAEVCAGLVLLDSCADANVVVFVAHCREASGAMRPRRRAPAAAVQTRALLRLRSGRASPLQLRAAASLAPTTPSRAPCSTRTSSICEQRGRRGRASSYAHACLLSAPRR